MTDYGSTPRDKDNIPLGCVYVPGVGLIPLQGYLVSTDGLTNTSALAAMAMMGQYNTVAPGLTNGQVSPLQLDAYGNLQVSSNTYLAGEDATQTVTNATGVIVVEQRFKQLGAIISSNTTTPTKASPGFIHTIFVGDPGSTWVLTIYNALSATGTPVIFKPTVAGVYPLNELYSVGITIVSTGGTPGNAKVIGR